MSGYDYSAEVANELLEAADQKIEELQAEIERLHGPRLAPEHVATLRACAEWHGDAEQKWTAAIRAALAALGDGAQSREREAVGGAWMDDLGGDELASAGF